MHGHAWPLLRRLILMISVKLLRWLLIDHVIVMMLLVLFVRAGGTTTPLLIDESRVCTTSLFSVNVGLTRHHIDAIIWVHLVAVVVWLVKVMLLLRWEARRLLVLVHSAHLAAEPL